MAQDDEMRRLQADVHDAILAGRLEEAQAKLAELQARQLAAAEAAASKQAARDRLRVVTPSGTGPRARPWWKFWQRYA